MADNYQDLAIRRQVLLERVKSGQYREFKKALKEIEKLIRVGILSLDELETTSRYKVEKLIRTLKADQIAVFQGAMETYALNLSTIAWVSMNQELLDLQNTIDLGNTKLKKFKKVDLYRKVLKRPLSVNGGLLDAFLKDFTDKEVKRINDTVRLAWSQGKTNAEAVRAIIGTKSGGYLDGILQTTRRNAETIVRTSVQHVASSARMEIWQNNPDVVRRYKWLSTLDRVTSNKCKSLDGLEFEFGKGPVPPIHPNCRSTTVPVTNPKYDFLDEGATRSAEFGPVDAKLDYYDWLKKQKPDVIEEALGKKRAKLFTDGGMSAEKFRKLQFDKNFDPLTLDEMKSIVPAAFKKAGL